ncbi:hypothetical protein P1X14_04565 [Sphingomonas sp. AOB5]|uniref:hypothetical protein n=1 Tax=Sphingomonas sp. AOB5 TaxID=3034017 RepID=UPI0023F76ED8|nr:hypothetical protein [Sphingomonas sp. AOB5]MDF7774509.1 hypothetical protein [Sphingomonas sp. AOB5]
MDYQLNITIDPVGLNMIYGANLAVVMVRSWESDPDSPLTIAWQMFQPLEMNQIDWSDSYQVYATNTQPLIGAQIEMMATAPAQLGWSYTYADGQFTGSAGGSDPQGVEITNQQDPELGLGLVQAASVNNVQVEFPTSFLRVLGGESATITPYETITIFVAPMTNSGSVIQSPPPNALMVEFSPQSPTAQIGFNDATNSFYLQQPS